MNGNIEISEWIETKAMWSFMCYFKFVQHIPSAYDSGYCVVAAAFVVVVEFCSVRCFVACRRSFHLRQTTDVNDRNILDNYAQIGKFRTR